MEQEQDEGDSTVVNHKFCRQALTALVPILLTQLVKQDEGAEDGGGMD